MTLRVTLEPRALQYFQQRRKLRLLSGAARGKNGRLVAATFAHLFALVFGNLTANRQKKTWQAFLPPRRAMVATGLEPVTPAM